MTGGPEEAGPRVSTRGPDHTIPEATNTTFNFVAMAGFTSITSHHQTAGTREVLAEAILHTVALSTATPSSKKGSSLEAKAQFQPLNSATSEGGVGSCYMPLCVT